MGTHRNTLYLLIPALGFALAAAASADELSIQASRRNDAQVEIAIRSEGVWTGHNLTVRQLLELAYDLNSGQLAGGPDWMNSTRFDVELKQAGESGAPSNEAVAQMLQTLLTDQFRLLFHRREMKVPVYLLVPVKDAKRDAVQEVADRARQLEIRPGRMRGEGIPIDMLAGRLAGLAGRPVLNRTNWDGYFDFDISWSAPGLEALQTALRDGLGLQLEASEGLINLFVVDRLEPRKP